MKARLTFFLLLGLQLLGLSVDAKNVKTDGLQRSTPEVEGISSAAILQYVEAVEKKNLGMHSFMLLRHGKVVAEGWWNPYRPDLKHIAHSVSKTFTSTAVGFAVNEKLMTVDDKVMCFFPEYLPDTITPALEQLTVKNLLTMADGHEPSPWFSITDGNWIKAFLSTPFTNTPGSKFVYSSTATYMVSAILQSITGQTLTGYLQPRLFEPLGMNDILWEQSFTGESCGGWGLRLKTSDLAKLGQLYLQDGKWKGKQLLPASWVKEATTAHIDQQPGLSSEDRAKSDWTQGYGYYIWRCRNNAFRADGASGQYIVVMPDQDMVMAITSESPDMAAELSLIWDILLPAVKDKKLPEEKRAYAALASKLSGLRLPVPFESNPALRAKVAAHEYVVEQNDLHIRQISVKVTGQECVLDLVTDDAAHRFICGNEAWIEGETERNSPYFDSMRRNPQGLSPFRVTGYYGWKDENTLQIQLLYPEDNTTETICITDEGKDASITLRKSSDTKAVQLKCLK